MWKTLLVDADGDHAQRVLALLRRRAIDLDRYESGEAAVRMLQRTRKSYDIVIINATAPCNEIFLTLKKLQELCLSARFLCVSSVNHGPIYRLRIERLGARFVYE
jgi:DNA-binding response OmpR family regulator